ncbi:MAG: DUF2510 domain-containing protein [Coriobacteriia bacterium]|nr:DUF2510 domain-containing protein [Coriobacteriia bacterium]
MRDGQCPECGSHEILVSTFPAGIWSDTDGVLVGQPVHCGLEPSGLGHQVQFVKGWRTFLCASCGHCEFFIDDPSAISAIANATGGGWSRVTAAGWLPDPAGRHELRYWDGLRWTAAVSDSGTQSEDPEGL